MFVVSDFRVEGARVQCGVPVVGLSDRPGLQVSVPVLVLVMGRWEAVEGRRCQAHLEPCNSLESESPLLQPPTLCELFHRGHEPEAIVGFAPNRLRC